MPELPEAETIVRGLRPVLTGRTISGAGVLHPDVLREPPRRFADKVEGRTILEVGRRGKNVVLRLADDHVLAVNLGMTGRLLPTAIVDPTLAGYRHPAVRFTLDDGEALVFDDTRRFGTVECLSSQEWRVRSDRMGPEPLAPDYSGTALWRALRASRAPVRSWLLDQRKVAGVGNIYANEALFLARLHPRRPARSLVREEADALYRAVRQVLQRAIEAGGTTLRDYRTAYGEEGGFAPRLHVYGRDGEPCTQCRTEIRRVVFGGRSAFYCPGCQPRRRRRK